MTTAIRADEKWGQALKKISVEYEALAIKLNISKKWRKLDSLSDKFSPCTSTTGSFRLMQWNVLARGLANDGFFVNPVLEDWPTDLSRFPMTNDKGSEPIGTLIEKMQNITTRVHREEVEDLNKQLRALNTTLEADLSTISKHQIKKFLPRHSIPESTAILAQLSGAERSLRLKESSAACGDSPALDMSTALIFEKKKLPPHSKHHRRQRQKASPSGAGSASPPPPGLALLYAQKSVCEEFHVPTVKLEEDLLRHTLRIQKMYRGNRARHDTKRLKKFMAEKISLLKSLQKVFATPHLSKNTKAVIDWDARWCRIRYQIIKTKPDILTMAEVDSLAQMQIDLGALGYECGFPGMVYRPMHACKDASMSYLDFLRQSGIAYAPNFMSNALAIGMGEMLDGKTFATAAEKMMGGHPFEKAWNARTLFKDRSFPLNGGTRRLWQEMKKIDPKTLDADTVDDDCSVVFWRRDKFSLSQIDYLDMSAKGKHKSAVRVKLIERSTGKSVQVMTTHLASGTAPKDNKKRMNEIHGKAAEAPSVVACEKVGVAATTTTSKAVSPAAAMKTAAPRTVKGLLGWYEDSCKAGRCILAMDANSKPQFFAPGCHKSVWKEFALASHNKSPTLGSKASGSTAVPALRRWESVWDSYFDEHGRPKATSSSSDPPVTVNKMRGTESQQPKKIGMHAYELIDHVFFSRGIVFLKHAVVPKQYASLKIAKEHLIPDLVFPTDHIPVVVDMKLS